MIDGASLTQNSQPSNVGAATNALTNHWRVYIILASNGSLYTGITTNMCKRWRQHSRRQGAKFFYGKKPIALCYVEPGHSRSSASQREYAIKQFTRKQKWALILQHYGPLLL